MLDLDVGTIEALLGPWTETTPAAGGATAVESTELQLRSMPDRWLELTTIRGGDPRDSRILIIRDVTMARRDETIGELLPTLISHELRTPMTTIYAAAQILRAAGDRPIDQQQMGLMEDLSVEVRRLHLLIDDLTVLSRDDPALWLTVQPELIQRVLPEIVTLQRRNWKDHDIEFHVNGEPGVTVVDRHALDHLMRDLISNAAHQEGDGPITVALGAHPQGGAVVSVADGGPGYRARERRLLRPIGFAHLVGETSGTAISLHVAYRLVAAMGGRIWARSRESGGEVAFWLRPLDDSEMDDFCDQVNQGMETGVRHVQ